MYLCNNIFSVHRKHNILPYNTLNPTSRDIQELINKKTETINKISTI